MEFVAMDGNSSVASPSIVSRASAIILSPRTEWARIAGEDAASSHVSSRYVVPLALIGPVAGVIGSQVFGRAPGGLTYHPSLTSALAGAFVAFILTIVTFGLLSLIADWLSPKFGGKVSPDSASKLVGYGSTPVWLCGIFALVPALGILSVLGLYSIYLIYLGVSPMMNVPREKAGSYTAVLILCGLVLNFVIAGLTATSIRLFATMGLFG